MPSHRKGLGMMISHVRAALLATAAVAAFSSVSPAQAAAADTATAAGDDATGGEVIVTAQKREQKLIDVPQSV